MTDSSTESNIFTSVEALVKKIATTNNIEYTANQQYDSSGKGHAVDRYRLKLDNKWVYITVETMVKRT